MELGLLFAGSLVLYLYWTATLPLWSFYLMPSRIWQFALGAVVFAWFHGSNQVTKEIPAQASSRLWSKVFGLVGLFIIGSALLLHPNLTYPGFWALIPSTGAALVIAAGHLPENRNDDTGGLLAHPATVWVGDRS